MEEKRYKANRSAAIQRQDRRRLRDSDIVPTAAEHGWQRPTAENPADVITYKSKPKK